MSREIKFSGLSVDNEWLYGSLYVRMEGDVRCAYIMDNDFEPSVVLQETTGEFTGLKDRYGVEIYEGDIVSDHVGVGQVKYSEKHGAFRVSYGDGLAKWFYDYILNGGRESIEVIGNIHENPELLEAK